jgi:protein SCO1/2
MCKRFGAICIMFIAIFIFGCTTPTDLPAIIKLDTQFSFYNQDSVLIDQSFVENKVYVVDFFFVSCPTICKTMGEQLQLVHRKFKNNKDFSIISHTIDPSRDDVKRLKAYSTKLGVENSASWNFLTGEQSKIYDLAKTYMLGAGVDEDAPGGFYHSGTFLLIDKSNQLRGIFDGTNPEEVSFMIDAIEHLLKEKPTTDE